MDFYGAMQTLEDEYGSNDTQMVIAREVMRHIPEENLRGVVFGVFDNLREYGLTLTLNGFSLCFYEHRNSDEMHVEGCEVKDIKEYGPYGGVSKWDTIASVSHCEFEALARIVSEILDFIRETVHVSRDDVVQVARSV